MIALFEQVDELGTIDVLVNNAGIAGGYGGIEVVHEEMLARLFAVNVGGAFLCAREAALRMRTDRGGKGGCICNISSKAAVIGGAGEWVHYAATKGAIDTMTVGLARELAPHGVRVNAVRPGLIVSDFHDHASPGRLERMAPQIPMLRSGSRRRGGHRRGVAVLGGGELRHRRVRRRHRRPLTPTATAQHQPAARPATAAVTHDADQHDRSAARRRRSASNSTPSSHGINSPPRPADGDERRRRLARQGQVLLGEGDHRGELRGDHQADDEHHDPQPDARPGDDDEHRPTSTISRPSDSGEHRAGRIRRDSGIASSRPQTKPVQKIAVTPVAVPAPP